MAKRTKTVTKVSEKDTSEHVPEEASNGSAVNGEISNGYCEMQEKLAHNEPCDVSEEVANPTEGKGPAELKAPKVLEVLKIVLFLFNVIVLSLLLYPIA